MACQVGCQFQSFYEIHQTNFTCQELIDYCRVYQKWSSIENIVDKTTDASLLLGGCLGFFSYILMVIVFRLPDFNGASYIYHKSTVYMELIHMFVMCGSGFTRLYGFPETYTFVIYKYILRELWIFGDAMKLAVSMVTTFLSMERFIAIWFPTSFARINKPKIAWLFVLISFLIGTLHLSSIFVKAQIVPQPGNSTNLYMVIFELGGEHVGSDEIISDIVYAIKITVSLSLVIFCVGVASGLILKSKKTSGMNSNALAKWKENRRLSILQIVIAILQIQDTLSWVINNILQDKEPRPFFMGIAAITQSGYTFGMALAAVNYRPIWRWTFAVQSISGILDHATRLPLCLVGMKKFREGFVALFQKNHANTPLISNNSANKATAPIAHGGAVAPLAT